MIGALLWGLWSSISSWLAPACVAPAIVAGVFFYGRSSGKADAKAQQAKANAKAIKQARGMENEISKMGGDDIDRGLSKWLRDGR
ncbi:hypothetical protein MYG64_26290 (plasmid) [Ensifer adhaerens]|uniref:hypothetical protein n=1 Tax=Ensifer adhaerens TaxID=106592 RepID=UPI002100AD1F|nr:hypothetical protein [Ensifer adhaerens]UTV39237.1 hypothetical protein MYG64_26290 [Ensifer adhaerens]